MATYLDKFLTVSSVRSNRVVKEVLHNEFLILSDMPFSCFEVGGSREDDIDVAVIGLLLIAENEARYEGIVIVVS